KDPHARDEPGRVEAERRLWDAARRRHADDRDHERGEDRAEPGTRGEPEPDENDAARPELRAQTFRRHALGLQVEEITPFVAQLAEDADPETQRGEGERDDRGRPEHEGGGVRGRIPPDLPLGWA